MKTYQDLLACGAGEREAFILRAMEEHLRSDAVREALVAQQYYAGENPTIARYEKILYDLQGRAHRDLYTANHKIASPFFQIAVDQENMYLLGNGVTFRDPATARRLGADFDLQLQRLSERALVDGVSFGFWGYDRLTVFRLTEFVPLYDEDTGALRAGIRFFRLEAGRPTHVTLYEEDGFTRYRRDPGAPLTLVAEKEPYAARVLRDPAGGEAVTEALGYGRLPILPLKNGDQARSELSGRRNTIDALDLATSNMVNNVDEGNLIYWVLTGCGGMDDLDDARFIQRLKTTHVAHADGDDNAAVSAHTIEAPFDGTQTAIDTLTRRLFTDFRAFDAAAVSAGNQTATAIKASYVPLDLKTDQFERSVTEFILGLLAMLGIDDAPAYTRNRVVNVKEEAETVLLGREFLDGEYVRRKLLNLLGDGDLA